MKRISVAMLLLPVPLLHAEELPLIPLCVNELSFKCGLMAREGKWVVPPKYESLRFVGDAWLAEKKIYTTNRTRIDVLNPQGKITASFADARKVADDTLITRDDNNSLFKLYRYNGELISDKLFSIVKPFSEGLAAAIDDSNYWGYINIKGQWIITPQYTHSDSFINGLATVSTPKMKDNSLENMVINKKNQIVMPYKSGRYYRRLDNHYWQVRHEIPDPAYEFSTITDKAYIVNNKGKIVINNVEIIGDWQWDATFYRQYKNDNYMYGIFAPRQLRVLVPAGSKDWEYTRGFEDGIGSVRTSRGWISVDKNGNTVPTPPEKEPLFITEINESYALNINRENSSFASPLEGINDYRGDGEFSNNLIKIPTLLWINDKEKKVKTLISKNDGILFKKVNLTHIDNNSCQSPVTIIYDKDDNIIWPKDPAIVCEAKNEKLEKHSLAAINLLMTQEELIKEELPEDIHIKNLPWQSGPVTLPLNEIAKLQLPQGYRFLPAEYGHALNQRESSLEGILNNENRFLIGFISPEKGWWRAALWIDRHDPIDYNFLNYMKPDTLLERLSSRYNGGPFSSTTLTIPTKLVWSAVPHWDLETHRLSWSVNPINSESNPFLKSVKFGDSWLIHMMLTNTENYSLFQQHSSPKHITDELNMLQNNVMFNEQQTYPQVKAGMGVDATMLITGEPTKMEKAIQQNFERETQKREEMQEQTIMHALKYIGIFLLIALSGGVTAAARKKKKTADNQE